MTNVVRIRKVTVLPGVFEASTLYMVRSASAGLFDLYLSTSDGASVRHIITQAEIQSMITTAMAGLSGVQVVATIAARNALAPTTNTQVMVLDATGDATVTSGTATYIYQVSNTTWYKISESESMDLVLNWASIQNKPTSTVANIDDAVAKKHSHTNIAVLDLLADSAGRLIYNGQPLRQALEEETW